MKPDYRKYLFGWPVEPFSCVNCVKCWRFTAGPQRGSCPYGGPYGGYVYE